MGNPIGGMRSALPSGKPTNRSGRPSTKLGLWGCGEGVTESSLLSESAEIPLRMRLNLQSKPTSILMSYPGIPCLTLQAERFNNLLSLKPSPGYHQNESLGWD